MEEPKETLTVRDKKGRVFIKGDHKGRIIIGRYPDMTEKDKNTVLKYCRTLLSDNNNLEEELEAIRKFISFESDENEFCS